MNATRKSGITRNVVLAGFTSFFTDISTEMIYPLLQAFLAMVMVPQRAFLGPMLGIIEGDKEILCIYDLSNLRVNQFHQILRLER